MPKVKQFNKEKVLEVASTIFHQKGYNGTSIDEILKATGLSRSSLYDSFKDKHNLYLQSLEFYKNAEKDGYETVNQKKLNGMQKIEFLFKEVVNHLVAHPNDNGCLMVNAAAEMSKHCEKTAKLICNNKEDMHELFTTWLNEAQTSKVINLSNAPKSYAPFLFNSLCGLKVLSQSGATKTELNNVVKVTLDAIV
ncbi:TetR/AcrR family transcriptional regulator [Aurantibacillus circumpalustris]|uniref:TetR/AcrR family transcriptional regulator n=1 Tax=Aurantibacillus circumpalustris TaxID=3036359 RepID=UPI00295A7BFD|nr:TetR/AcrR family transcriptional regulator [Aurantibacillus circumpalustris]